MKMKKITMKDKNKTNEEGYLILHLAEQLCHLPRKGTN